MTLIERLQHIIRAIRCPAAQVRFVDAEGKKKPVVLARSFSSFKPVGKLDPASCGLGRKPIAFRVLNIDGKEDPRPKGRGIS